MFHLHCAKEERTRKTTDGTEDEIQRSGKGGVVECHVQTFHQDFRCSGIGAHINAHVAHNAEETE